MARMRSGRMGALALLGLAWLGLPVGASSAEAPAASPAANPTPPQTDAGVSVYRKVLPATVWVVSERGPGRFATGSGSLVDHGRRLVLTNYHVVGNQKDATVFFPQFDRNHQLITDRKAYVERRRDWGIPAEVVELDREADLALLRLERLPAGVTALPLAAASPDPGQPVHSIGNPGRSGALWVYTEGKVRQVYTKKWKAQLEPRQVVEFQARVIETSSPTNPGDSGGPLVNDRGELVGVTQGGAVDAQLLSIFIDVSEVRRLLNRRSVRALRSFEASPGDAAPLAKTPPAAPRDKPVASEDAARLFSPEAWQKALATAEDLFRLKKEDLVIRTIPSPPDGDAERVKAMSESDRRNYFRSEVRRRVEQDKVKGIYLLICKSPPSLLFEITPEVSSHYPADFAPKFQEALLSAFRAGRFDDGLAKALELIREARGLK